MDNKIKNYEVDDEWKMTKMSNQRKLTAETNGYRLSPRTKFASQGSTQNEIEEIPNDEFLFCDSCKKRYYGECPKHGPLFYVDDKRVELGMKDRARLTAPDCICFDKSTSTVETCLGAFAKEDLKVRMRFGPWEGVSTTDYAKAMKNNYAWIIEDDNGEITDCIDASDRTRSNWMRYVRCAQTKEESNLVAFQYYGSIYYRTIKDVPVNSELLLWFACVKAGGPLVAEQKPKKIDIKEESTPTLDITVKPELEDTAFTNCCEKNDNNVVSPRKSTEVKTLKEYPMLFEGIKEELIIYQCKLCNIEFSMLYELRNHVKCFHRKRAETLEAHTLPNQVPSCSVQPQDGNFKCLKCDHVFTDQKWLDMHLKYKHRRDHGIGKYKCDKSNCNYATDSKCMLLYHQVIHKKPLFKCGECPKMCNNPNNLKKHVQTVHRKLRPYVCNICLNAFGENRTLTVHMRIMHTGEKPFRCPKCAFTAAHVQAMRHHLKRAHESLQSHTCPVCNKSFRQLKTLVSHEKNAH